MEIAILLTTYNSERFLIPQLDSILNQTYKEFILYIKDDGSSDATLQIIKEYENNNDNIKIIEDGITGRGVIENFKFLLKTVNSKFYMFCDHDDVWLPNKIMFSYDRIRNLQSIHTNKPIIVHTDLEVVDSNLITINKSFWNYCKINPVLMQNFENLIVSNGVTGCTMIFNEKAEQVSLPFGKNATMHDAWMALKVTYNNGIIDFIQSPTLLYRQHSGNLVGAKKTGLKEYLVKMNNPKSILSQNYSRYLMVNEIKSTNIFTYFFLKLLYFLRK